MSRSLHDELYFDAAALLLEVQGAPRVENEAPFEIFFDGLAEALRVDGLVSSFEIDRTDATVGAMSTRKQVERCQARLNSLDSKGLPWKPEFTMKVRIGQDNEKWSVTKISGVGSALVSIALWRPYLVNVQVAGRERR